MHTAPFLGFRVQTSPRDQVSTHHSTANSSSHSSPELHKALECHSVAGDDKDVVILVAFSKDNFTKTLRKTFLMTVLGMCPKDEV